MAKKKIAVISTGGTIEKTYDELEGVLHNQYSVLDVMIASLQLEGVDLVRIPLMNVDSLNMSAEDHTLVAETAKAMSAAHDGVVIVHGTDRLAQSGNTCVTVLKEPRVPVVLTGAMRPYMLRNTDAVQNLTEALLAVQILAPGIWLVMHNQVLPFPGAVKDPAKGTFVWRGGMEPA